MKNKRLPEGSEWPWRPSDPRAAGRGWNPGAFLGFLAHILNYLKILLREMKGGNLDLIRP